MSQFLPPPTPRRTTPSYKKARREIQRTPQIGERPHARPVEAAFDTAFYSVRNQRIPQQNPSHFQSQSLVEAMGPQLPQQFAELAALRNRNQQRIGYLQL